MTGMCLAYYFLLFFAPPFFPMTSTTSIPLPYMIGQGLLLSLLSTYRSSSSNSQHIDVFPTYPVTGRLCFHIHMFEGHEKDCALLVVSGVEPMYEIGEVEDLYVIQQ